jgi:hypothetical protein
MTHPSPEHATTEHPDMRTLAGSELPTLTLLHQLGAGGLVASTIPAVAFVVVYPLGWWKLPDPPHLVGAA